MFTNDDVLTLAKAGFTAAQIAALAETTKPAEQPKQAEPKQIEIKKPAEKPAEKPVEKEENKPDPLAAKIDELIKTVQGININNSQQPQMENTDAILAAIINPPINNK